MSSLVCRGMKLTSVLFLGLILLPPLIVFSFTCIVFCFFLFLPILCMFNVAVLEYKIFVRRPLRYIAMSLVNFRLWVLDDWSKTHELFVIYSMEVDPLEFQYPDDSEEEEQEQEQEQEDEDKGGMLSKHKDSRPLQALKSANRELNPSVQDSMEKSESKYVSWAKLYSAQELVHAAIKYHTKFLAARGCKYKIPYSWVPPSRGYLKINFDGVIFMEDRVIGVRVIARNEAGELGVVARNEAGEFMAGMANINGWAPVPELDKASAGVEAIQFALGSGC